VVVGLRHSLPSDDEDDCQDDDGSGTQTSLADISLADTKVAGDGPGQLGCSGARHG